MASDCNTKKKAPAPTAGAKEKKKLDYKPQAATMGGGRKEKRGN